MDRRRGREAVDELQQAYAMIKKRQKLNRKLQEGRDEDFQEDAMERTMLVAAQPATTAIIQKRMSRMTSTTEEPK